MTTMADIFNAPEFSVTSLTDAINNVPFVPGRAGQVVDWEEEPITTTSVLIEEQGGELVILNPTSRGGPGSSGGDKDKRRARSLIVPHYEHNDLVMAESVQNVRAFGTTSELETMLSRVQRKLQQHVQLKHDPTLEYQRLGALKGVIVNGDGTVLYNLFNEFNVTAYAEVDFDLDNATPAAGALRKKCDEVARKAADALGGLPMVGLRALCGDAFWDDLMAHKEVREVYSASQVQALRLLSGTAYGKDTITIGDITFENYRGGIGANKFVDTNKCHIFPEGTPGLYRTVYAPADYIETVNTEGLPRYAKQYPMPNGKGVHLDTQMNALNYCTRPQALIQGKRT